MADKRLLTDEELKRERRNAKGGFATMLLDHCDAVNELLKEIEQLTHDVGVLIRVSEILYGEE